MTSAMQNILMGVQENARLREQAEKKADILNEQEKLAYQQEQQAGASSEAVEGQSGEPMEQMTPEQMNEAIQFLSKTVLELQARLDGKGVSV